MQIHVDLDYSTRDAIKEMVKLAADKATAAADRASRRATAVALMQALIERTPSLPVGDAYIRALDIIRKTEL